MRTWWVLIAKVHLELDFYDTNYFLMLNNKRTVYWKISITTWRMEKECMSGIIVKDLKGKNK